MRRDHRGMSLIELIIAVTVSVIIMGAVIMFISNALRSYDLASSTIDLQMESHVLMEQLATWIMEGDEIVTDVGSTTAYTIPVDDGSTRKALVIYTLPRQVDVDRLPIGTTVDESGRVVAATGPTPSPGVSRTAASRRVIWIESGAGSSNGLYMMELTGISDPATDIPSLLTTDVSRLNCISQYLTDFNYDWDDDKGIVSITLTLESGSQEYTLQDQITVRSETVAAPSPSPTPTSGP